MSVILTACRHSRQKAIARALKKKAEKKKERRAAASNYLAASSSQYNDDEIPDDNLKIWTFLLNGRKTSIVLRLETLEVACNGVPVNTFENFCDCYLTIDFPLGERKGRISTAIDDDDPSAITLTIDGTLVPDSPE